MAAVKSGRHFELEGFERVRGESGMETEPDVSRELGLVVLEMERYNDASVPDPVGQVERNLERVFGRGKIVGGNSVDQFIGATGVDPVPDLAAKKAMRAAANFAAAIKRALVLDPVKEISHHRGVVR